MSLAIHDRSTSFASIAECRVEDFVQWNNSCFLTFDIDWACDAVLADTIDLVEQAGVAATWFATHETPLLERLRDNDKFELGIHPNFNYLLNCDSRNGKDAEEVIDKLLTLVPEAKSVRSHSLTQNSRLQQVFWDKGLTHECNHFIPEQAGLDLKPWTLWNGMIKMPHFWEDDAAIIYGRQFSANDLITRGGLKIFAFHPIHVYLNTERLDRYDNSRAVHHSPGELAKHRFAGVGTRTALLNLLGLNSSESQRRETDWDVVPS